MMVEYMGLISGIVIGGVFGTIFDRMFEHMDRTERHYSWVEAKDIFISNEPAIFKLNEGGRRI